MNTLKYQINYKFKEYFEKCLFAVHDLKNATILKKKRVKNNYVYDILTYAKLDFLHILQFINREEEKCKENLTFKVLINMFLEGKNMPDENNRYELKINKNIISDIEDMREAIYGDERIICYTYLRRIDSYIIGLLDATSKSIHIVLIQQDRMVDFESPSFDFFKGFFRNVGEINDNKDVLEDSKKIDNIILECLNESYQHWVEDEFEGDIILL